MTEGRAVAAVTPYSRTGGSSRVRVHEWVRFVPELGTVISSRRGGGQWRSPATAGAMASAAVRCGGLYRRLRAGTVETLLLHREASAVGQGFPERALLRAAQLGVYDFDDALYEDHGNGGTRARFPKSRIVAAAVAAADRVIAANDHLGEWAEQHSDDVVVIPSCVDPTSYRWYEHNGSDGLSIVWLGSPATSTFLHEITGPLRTIARRHGARLRAIGAAESVRSIGSFVDVVPWHPSIEGDIGAHGSVGIMPMIDTPYVRGKSAYKLLQYAAAGLPSVFAPVGASAAIGDRLGASPATTPGEWVDALDELLTSATVRADRGRRSRLAVEEHFSYQRWLPTFRLALGLQPGDNAPRAS